MSGSTRWARGPTGWDSARRWRRRFRRALVERDRGKVLVQTMLMLAGGGEACSDSEHLRAQPELFGAGPAELARFGEVLLAIVSIYATRMTQVQLRSFTLHLFSQDMINDIALAAAVVGAEELAIGDWIENAEIDLEHAPYLGRLR